MAKRAATIVDVARAVGVSPSTVSHAISGKREISTPVKERIFEKIRELDYRPSFFAQALKRSSTGLIGVVANECRNPGAAVFIDGLAAELEKYSYRPVVGLTGLNHRKGEEMLSRFSTGLVDGVINLLPQIRPEEAQQLCGSVPVVTNIREQPVPVWLDYDKLTRDILSFLWDRGHRRIGYITSPVRMYDRADTTVGVMKTFFGERGAEFGPGWVFEGEDSIESGISGAERIMKDGGVTAIFTGNDQMAFGVYRWAYRNGVKIPDELSVVGFDDVPQAATIIPPLTTVRFPVEEIVRHTVELLVTKLNRRPLTPGRMTPEMPLVIRDSVADRTQETHNRQYVKLHGIPVEPSNRLSAMHCIAA